MAIDQSYNHDHWDRRLRQYIAAEWSTKPTPFAELVASYLQPKSHVLELGAGGGQDSLWFAQQGYVVTMTDGSDVVFDDIKQRAEKSDTQLNCQIVDMSKQLPFTNEAFDLVYSQLAIHYFDDETTRAIMREISRVLKPGGLFAGMVNSVEDPEYDAAHVTEDGLLNVSGLIKRYFTLESFRPFLSRFHIELFDAKGTTPKDNEKDTHHLIRFIVRKP